MEPGQQKHSAIQIARTKHLPHRRIRVRPFLFIGNSFVLAHCSIQGCWTHYIELLNEEQSQTAAPGLIVLDAAECCHVEDCGGITGWEEIKRIWDPNTDRIRIREKMQWAQWASPLGEAFNTFSTPDIDSLNLPGSFESFVATAYAEEEEEFVCI